MEFAMLIVAAGKHQPVQKDCRDVKMVFAVRSACTMMDAAWIASTIAVTANALPVRMDAHLLLQVTWMPNDVF